MIHESKKTDLFDIKLAKLKVPAHGASEAVWRLQGYKCPPNSGGMLLEVLYICLSRHLKY